MITRNEAIEACTNRFGARHGQGVLLTWDGDKITAQDLNDGAEYQIRRHRGRVLLVRA
jgi:hypothetical protein